jgi:hypothetical protein
MTGALRVAGAVVCASCWRAVVAQFGDQEGAERTLVEQEFREAGALPLDIRPLLECCPAHPLHNATATHCAGIDKSPLSDFDFVCSQKCQANEPMLTEKLLPWWEPSNLIDIEIFEEMCSRSTDLATFDVIYSIVDNELYVHFCGQGITSLEMLDGLAEEFAGRNWQEQKPTMGKWKEGSLPDFLTSPFVLFHQLEALKQHVALPNLLFGKAEHDTANQLKEGVALPVLSTETTDFHWDM